MKTITHRLIRALAAGGLLLCGMAAQAAVLYSQAPLDQGEALAAAADSANSFGGSQNADDFVLQTGSTVTGFQWWGTEADESKFVLRLFGNPLDDNATALPATVVRNETNLTADDSRAIFLYEATLQSAISAAAGGSFHLSVLFDSTDPDAWFWLESDPSSTSFFRGVDGDGWDEDIPGLAFAVLGDRATPVDEPAALWLVGVAGLALWSSRRQQAAKKAS